MKGGLASKSQKSVGWTQPAEAAPPVNGPPGGPEEDCVSLRPGCWRKLKGPAHGSRRPAGRDSSVSKATAVAHSSPQEAACFSRVLTLFPAVCCLIARALATRSWISAPEANLRTVLGETLLCMLRSYGKPVVNECGLRVNSAVLRFQGNSHLVHKRRYLQGYEVTWIQTDLEKNASRNLRVQFRFDCTQIEFCWIMLPEWGKKNQKQPSRSAAFGVNRCVSTCVYPEGGRNHSPQHSVILL